MSNTLVTGLLAFTPERPERPDCRRAAVPAPTEFYMLQHKNGPWFCRAGNSSPAVWTSVAGPRSAIGTLRAPGKKDWKIRVFTAKND